MHVNWLDIGYRRKVIKEIKGDENIQRKIVSKKKYNMQNDNFNNYVTEYLEAKLDAETVKELTVFSNVNLQKRISKSEASVYKHGVDRQFFIGNTEVEEFHDIYSKMNIDTMLRRANEAYKYQDQCLLQVVPKKGDLVLKLLLPHHYDVIPDHTNPEKAHSYIVSNFDNTNRNEVGRDENLRANRTGFSQGDKYRDGVNQNIGDWDDPKLSEERFYVWSDELNFVMNGRGEILDKETESIVVEIEDENDPQVKSPLSEYGIKPCVDISSPKDFEFWVRSGDILFWATIFYNIILTSEYQVVEMQGHAQPFYKGDAEHMPENIRIGVDKMIFIPVNPINEVSSEFGFANPGSDLSGVREFRESWLASFLSSRGLDISIISGKSNKQTATSGVERMLQMIEKFEASLEDFALFENVEHQLFKIIFHWIKALRGERENGELVIDELYQLSLQDFKKSSLSVEFKKPEMIKTDMEILEVLEKEIEMGISSELHALMEYKGMSLDEAKKRIREIRDIEREMLPAPSGNQPGEIINES